MKVLVLHPNDELKLIKLSKEISTIFLERKNDFGNVKVFRNFPLWCCLPDIEGENLDSREIAKKISSVVLSSPKIQKESEEICIVLPVELMFEDGKKVQSSFLLSFFSDNLKSVPILELPEFHLNVNIFRIGDANFDGNQYYITDGSWRKLKK